MSTIELKSPCFPAFSKEDFSLGFFTPLWKRGEGEIFARSY
jgi:hypothetical protein